MIDAAQQAYIVYEPTQVLDAAHAALFAHPNVSFLHAKSMGHDIEKAFDGLDIHDDMLLATMDGRLTTVFFARLMRVREDTYFYKQLQVLKKDGIKPQQARLAREVAGKT